MKNIKTLTLILLASLLVACGPSQKHDQGKNEKDKGKTGQGQGDGSEGNGRNPPPRVPTFGEYCASLKGTINANTCKYPSFNVAITLPPDAPQMYRIDLTTVHEGMSVQAKGDPNNAGILYFNKNGNLTQLFTINEKMNRARLVGIGNGALTFISTSKFTVPAEITLFECRTPERNLTVCLD